MKAKHILGFGARPAAIALLALLPGACAYIEGPPPAASPLIGTWSNADNDRVTFTAATVIVTPNNGKPTAMGPADCNGVFKIAYGRMETAPLTASFPSQPDLQAKIKTALTRPEYPVADVTCDQGGTTYLMLDDHQMLAIYRDAGVGGLERLTRM
jgi:hypothetical protein